MPCRSQPFGLAAVLVFLLAYCSCGDPPSDLIDRAFRLLPPRQAVIVYLDVEKAGPRIIERLSEVVNPTEDEESRGRPFSLLYRRGIPPDIDALAFAADEHRRTLLLFPPDGQFTNDALRERLAAAGVECSQPLDKAPCAGPSLDPARRLQLAMVDSDVLSLSDSTTDAPAAPLQPRSSPEAEKRAVEARRVLEGDGIAWAAIIPQQLPAAMGIEIGVGSPVELLTRALGPAQVAYFSLMAPEGGVIELHLRAEFATPEAAREQAGVLKGLSAFSAAMIGSGGKSSQPWSRVLRSGRFRHEAEEAHAVWSLEALFESRRPERQQ